MDNLFEKLEKGFYIANKIFNLVDDGILKEDINDRIGSHADGLINNYAFNMIEGRGSIKVITEFDPAEFEKIIDNDLTEMEKALHINQIMKNEANSVYKNNHARITAVYPIACELYKQKYNEKHIPFSWEMEEGILKHAEVIEEVLYCSKQ